MNPLQLRRDKDENQVGERLRDPNHQKRTGEGGGKGACWLTDLQLDSARSSRTGKNCLGEKQLVRKIRDEVTGSEKSSIPRDFLFSVFWVIPQFPFLSLNIHTRNNTQGNKRNQSLSSWTSYEDMSRTLEIKHAYKLLAKKKLKWCKSLFCFTIIFKYFPLSSFSLNFKF